MSGSPKPFVGLERQEYMSLTTFRKTGVPVSTPVWFAQAENRLYVLTDKKSGKVKRIRNNSAVTVAPCTSSGKLLGSAVEAQVRILPPEEESAAVRALNKKYSWKKKVFELMLVLQRSKRQNIYLEIVER
ncbi:MAG: PPOX class F420-dependent oxidoreductase [Chloroflexi bacterium]|nr:PPOX class F420-dependent oxidoreductase [Chloroflexota bacterium]